MKAGRLHIVLLDNGRSRMLAHPVTRQSLACIRCGACLNALSVTSRSRPCRTALCIRDLLRCDQRRSCQASPDVAITLCVQLCGACREVCPVKIDIPRLLLHLRSEITQSHERGSDAKGIRRQSRNAIRQLRADPFRVASAFVTLCESRYASAGAVEEYRSCRANFAAAPHKLDALGNCDVWRGLTTAGVITAPIGPGYTEPYAWPPICWYTGHAFKQAPHRMQASDCRVTGWAAFASDRYRAIRLCSSSALHHGSSFWCP